MDYQFDVDHAKRYGLEEAVMLHNFIFWIRHNHANGKNQHDGRTWTYNTLEAFRELFPFWSVKQIRRILDSLLEQRVLVKGNHNARAYDRTCWYALADESLLELPGPICPNGQKDLPKRAEGSAQTGGPIPDLKQDKKPERGERAHRPAEKTFLPGQIPAPEPDSSLSFLLTRIKQEAHARGAPLVVGKDFAAGIVELVKAGTSEADLLEAFTACIEELPEKASFFPRDFLKWRKVSRERRAGEERADHVRGERQAREGELAKEREQILREREDPYWQAQIEAAIAQLPWRKVQG